MQVHLDNTEVFFSRKFVRFLSERLESPLLHVLTTARRSSIAMGSCRRAPPSRAIIATKAIANIQGKGPLNEGAAKMPRGKRTMCFMPDLDEEPHFSVFFYALQNGILSPETTN